MNYIFDSENFTRLTVTAKKTIGACGSIRLIQNGSAVADSYYKYKGYETYTLPLATHTNYCIECKDVDISFAYAFSENNLLEKGITCLKFDDSGILKYNNENMDTAYCQKYRNQFHFSPFTGWMNDPNGLCWYQGYYHMFYQFNPNSDKWGNMHWGHAVSRDLIHWNHLPITFYPQIELLDNPEFRGGAFSGSALINEGQMHLFFTRHFGKNDRSWQRQWQVTSKSNDGRSFSTEEVCIWGTPEGVFYDFRDPKVVAYKGRWMMVLGGTHFHKPAILWYSSTDLKNWDYQGVLFKETDPKYGISECPDFFCLDGQYVLLVGYIYSDTTIPQRRDTKYYVGSFDGATFVPEKQGIVDYGKDFYAAQSMEHDGRRIAIGWNTTGQDAYVSEPGCANGTASLPRELYLQDGHLRSYPIAEIAMLLETPIFEGSADNMDIVLAGGPYCLELTGLQGESELSGELVYNAHESVSFQLREQQFSLVLGSGLTCSFSVDDLIEDLVIYVDRSLIEIFINKGTYTCTRRFYLTDAVYAVRNLTLGHSSRHIKICNMKSIWGHQGGTAI